MEKIIWTDHVKKEVVLSGVEEERHNLLYMYNNKKEG